MRRIAVAGHLCVDLIPTLTAPARIDPGALISVGPMEIALGGCVANTSRVLASLGHPVAAYASVGRDDLGRMARARLESPLVEPHLRDVDGATSYSLVIEQPGADRTFWHHIGANAQVDGVDVGVDDIDLLHLGYPSLLPALTASRGEALGVLLDRARAADVTTSVDLAVVERGSPDVQADWPALLRAFTTRIDVLSPSVDDLASVLPSEAAGRSGLARAAAYADLLVSWGVAVALVSAGAQGAAIRTACVARLEAGGRALRPLARAWADLALSIPAVVVDAVRSTNGAGDASSAGLLYAISRGFSAQRAVVMASVAAAAAVSGRAVTPEVVMGLAPGLGSAFLVGGEPLS